jgi:hypothetical protein
MVREPASDKKIYMKLVNASEEFIVKFNGTDYPIPNGEFEVVNGALAAHILYKAMRVGKDVKDITKTDAPAIKPIAKKEAIKATPVHSGASTETLPKKTAK